MTRKPGKPRAAKRKVQKPKPVQPYSLVSPLMKSIYGEKIMQMLREGQPYTKQYGPMRAASDKGPITITKSGAILHTNA